MNKESDWKDDLKNLTKQVQGWASDNERWLTPTLVGALGAGVGAVGTGKQRDTETDGEYRMRKLRNALLLGVLGGGGTAAVSEGLRAVLNARPTGEGEGGIIKNMNNTAIQLGDAATEANRTMRKANDAIDTAVTGAKYGAGTGAGSWAGYILAKLGIINRAENRNERISKARNERTTALHNLSENVGAKRDIAYTLRQNTNDVGKTTTTKSIFDKLTRAIALPDGYENLIRVGVMNDIPTEVNGKRTAFGTLLQKGQADNIIGFDRVTALKDESATIRELANMNKSKFPVSKFGRGAIGAGAALGGALAGGLATHVGNQLYNGELTGNDLGALSLTYGTPVATTLLGYGAGNSLVNHLVDSNTKLDKARSLKSTIDSNVINTLEKLHADTIKQPNFSNDLVRQLSSKDAYPKPTSPRDIKPINSLSSHYGKNAGEIPHLLRYLTANKIPFTHNIDGPPNTASATVADQLLAQIKKQGNKTVLDSLLNNINEVNKDLNSLENLNRHDYGIARRGIGRGSIRWGGAGLGLLFGALAGEYAGKAFAPNKDLVTPVNK